MSAWSWSESADHPCPRSRSEGGGRGGGVLRPKGPLPPPHNRGVVCSSRVSCCIACSRRSADCRESIMKFPRRTFLHLAVGAAALPALPRLSHAQAYPSRPVRIVVGFAA